MGDEGVSDKPIVFIGAAGAVCGLAIKHFAAVSDVPLVLCDINMAPLESLRASLPPSRATIKKLDLFDRAAVAEIIRDARLVVLGAGPFIRTAEPVIKICLEAKVPYLDFDDDVESTQASLNLHDEAVAAGVPCFINCGVSPGLANVMALDVAGKLDTVHSIDVCWLTGHEGFVAGRATLEHLMHIAGGTTLTWDNQRATLRESYVETASAAMIGANDQPLRETAHPEPVTLARRFSSAQRILCFGGLDPPPKMGIARGLSVAYHRGDVSMDQIVGFYRSLQQEQLQSTNLGQLLSTVTVPGVAGAWSLTGSWHLLTRATHATAPYYYALMGMIDQWKSGQITLSSIVHFVSQVLRGEKIPYKGGLLVRATGIRNGTPATVIKRTPTCGPDSGLWKSVSEVTGIACASFMVLALEQNTRGHKGVLAPEDWVVPDVLYGVLERIGVPGDEIVETILA